MARTSALPDWRLRSATRGRERGRRWSTAIARLASAVAVPCWGLCSAATTLLSVTGLRTLDGALPSDELPARAARPRSRRSTQEPEEDASASFDNSQGASADVPESADERSQPEYQGRKKSGSLGSMKHSRAVPDDHSAAVGKPRPSAPPHVEDPFPHLRDRYTRVANKAVKREVEAMVRAEALRAAWSAGDAATAPQPTALFSPANVQGTPVVPLQNAPQQVTYVPVAMQSASSALPVAVYPSGALATRHGGPTAQSHAFAAAVPLSAAIFSLTGTTGPLPPSPQGWGTAYGPVIGLERHPNEEKPYSNRTYQEVHPGSAHAKVLAVGATCLVGAAAGACVLTTCLKKGRASERQSRSWAADSASLHTDSRAKTKNPALARIEPQSELQIVGVIPTTAVARL